MKTKQLFILIVLLFYSCVVNEHLTGDIKKIGIETFSVDFSNGKDSVLIKTQEAGWLIYSVILEDAEFVNKGIIKSYPNRIVSTVHDTLVGEWITLIKTTPVELNISAQDYPELATRLKIIVQENPEAASRSATVRLVGGVGFFGEDLQVTQKGKY